MKQLKKRINGIIQTLDQLRYTDTFDIKELKMIEIGYGQRSVMEESSETWEVFHQGDTWGGPDRHFCFKKQLTLPDHFEGKAVVIRLNTGATDIWNTDNPQFIAYVDGEMICAMDMNHYEVRLTQAAEKGRVYEFGLYAYSNSKRPNIFLDLTVSVHHLDVEKLYYDLKVPFEVAGLLRDEDLKAIRTLELLNRTVSYLDLRDCSHEAFYASVSATEVFLRKEYYEKLCGSSEVIVHSIGHTHIDVAWKWRVRQTREKTLRSFSTVIDLMNRYPEYKFMSSQPQLYQFVKEDCPQLYAKIKEKVAEGRWEVEGAMWLEADSNLTSGESLIRQILYGKQFIKEEFGGADNGILWLPDVFGYSAALPQILRKSGIKYFMTTKIGWNDHNKIPNDTMLWQGIDGSEVLTYFITTKNYDPYPDLTRVPVINTTYNGRQNASQIMGTWQRYQNKGINQEVLTCYGYGDGGGGVTAEMLEESRRLETGIPGCPQVKQTFARTFFETLEQNLQGKKIPKWCGELYLEFHRGAYTSMARNKRYNRLCEFKNADAEFFSVFLMKKTGSHEYPTKQLKRVWELTMLNQFHDILPGTSIKEVYEDSTRDYEEILRLDGDIIDKGQKAIMDQILGTTSGVEKAVVLFNQLSFERSGIIEIEASEDMSILMDAVPVISQKTAQDTMIYLVEQVPEKGYCAYPMGHGAGGVNHSDIRIVIEGKQVETPYYSIEFNPEGEFISIYDKFAHRELIKAGETANSLIVFEDRPEEYDAWNIDATYEEKQWQVKDLQEWQVLENGAIRTCIYLKRRFMNSTIEQVITLYNYSRRIDFKTTVDWKASQLLLKVAFPMDIMTNKATYEIQYGNIERHTHRNTSWDEAKFEVCGHKWADISEPGYGVAVLNDSKYGYDILGTRLRMTLLKSGIFPNPEADQEIHHFTYALLPHMGDFRGGKVIQEAYDLNCPMYGLVKEMAHKIESMSESLFTVDAENVFVDVVKKAEDNEDSVIRMYEAYGMRVSVIMDLKGMKASRVWACDLMEKCEAEVPIRAGKVEFEIKPYEIKTFRILQ